jgi:type IV secretory pathway VirB2 component (pilin)
VNVKTALIISAVNFIPVAAEAKGVGQGLTSLNDSIKNEVGLASVVLAITIAGLYIAFGKKEGTEKFGAAVTGALVVAFAASIGSIIWTASR